MAAKKRLKRSPGYTEQPQDYEHRVEIAIEALLHATIGVQMIVKFLRQQQSPDWHETRLIEVAAEDFGKAIGWLENRDVGKIKRRRAGKRR